MTPWWKRTCKLDSVRKLLLGSTVQKEVIDNWIPSQVHKLFRCNKWLPFWFLFVLSFWWWFWFCCFLEVLTVRISRFHLPLRNRNFRSRIQDRVHKPPRSL